MLLLGAGCAPSALETQENIEANTGDDAVNGIAVGEPNPGADDDANPNDADDKVPAPADDTAANIGEVKEFTVTGENFAFAPNVMSVKQGDTVRITFKNIDGFHDLKIDEFEVATKQIPGGSEETIEFVANQAGSFEFYCSVGKHRDMGMKGTLTVTE